VRPCARPSHCCSFRCSSRARSLYIGTNIGVCICRCEHGKYRTPFFVLPTVNQLPGRTNLTKLYCFETGVVRSQYVVQVSDI
jgi:hypothetical protein